LREAAARNIGDYGRFLEMAALESGKPINLCGSTDLSELISLIERCKVFVTSDSAPMHMASAIGTPFVALFGPTDPKRHVASAHDYEVLFKDVKCSPCYLKKCPIGHICMNQISVNDVLRAIHKLLSLKKDLKDRTTQSPLA